MKSTITSRMSRKQFAAAVVKQLQLHQISCVLVGGACVSIYTNEEYRSRDLDFISSHSHENIKLALKEIGFEKRGKNFFHQEIEFYVEFPSGPLAIGSDHSVKPEGKFEIRGTVVKMLSPTQCVMDRLAAWFHWNDRRSLIHALRVADAQPINLNKIKKWAKNESAAEKLEQFLLELKKLRKT